MSKKLRFLAAFLLVLQLAFFVRAIDEKPEGVSIGNKARHAIEACLSTSLPRIAHHKHHQDNRTDTPRLSGSVRPDFCILSVCGHEEFREHWAGFKPSQPRGLWLMYRSLLI